MYSREEHPSAETLLFTEQPEVRSLRKVAGDTYRKYDRMDSLSVPNERLIRAGIAGGLPFDSLTTDLISGCLPGAQVCYGNCFAAKAAFENNFDFGHRIKNILDRDILEADLEAISEHQGFLRNGWNSDPSWNWVGAAELAALIRQSGRLPVFITKFFQPAKPSEIEVLVRAGAEIRISVSAFDSASQLRFRARAAETYRDAGGIAIPIIMTTKFIDPTIQNRQDEIVNFFVGNDFPLAENSLRFSQDTAVIKAVDLQQCKLTADTKDYWAGRLYTNLGTPTLTSVPKSYQGLQSPYCSENDPDFLKSLWHDPVRTHDEVMSEIPYRKPLQCGVAQSWSEKTSG